MRKCSVRLVIFTNCLLFLASNAIILTNQEQPKPGYTSGIKTTGWRNPNSLQTHQNYSKVYHHNNVSSPSHYVTTRTDRYERVYPVYNAHSYGQQPEQTQNIVGTHAQQRQNATHPGNLATVVGANIAAAHKNRTIYKRKIEYKTIEVYEKCPKGATGSFVYYLSCNQFLNCWKGRGEVQNCAPGTLFNPKSLECDFPEKVDCITGSQNSPLLETASRSQKSVVQATCPEEFSGLIPNYTDCSKFISCNNGQQASMDCPPGTLFDTTLNVCNFQHLTKCFSAQSGDSQSSESFAQESQSQFYQGQYQGQRNGFQGHTVGQGGGQYSQTTYSQTSHGQNCNPQTQQCAYSSGQGQHAYGTQYSSGLSQGQQYGSGNQGQYHQHGSSHHITNIDSKLDFNGHQQSTYNQIPSNRGQRIYVQTSRGTPNCNPQTQNCASSTGSSISTFSSTQNCNPQIQNCPQGVGTNFQQVYGYSSVPTCDPSIQNCGQSHGSGSQSQGYGQSFRPGCDPRVQNCGQGYVSTHQQAPGHSSVPNCNPQTQNCGQGYGYSATTQLHGSSHFAGSTQRTTTNEAYGSGQQNFHKVCNINDLNCRKNGTTVTKRNKEPKCPKNFQGITKHPTDCKKFLNCANGITFIQDCAPGTLFNPAIGNCDFPYNVDCASSEAEETTTQSYEGSTERDWGTIYNQHAQQYGQNAGHGNIRSSTTARPQLQTSQSAGQGYYYQGQWQGSHQQGGYDQSQSTPSYGSNDAGAINTNQGIYTTWNTNQGSTSTVSQPLTPRPAHVTNIPVINTGQIGVVSRPIQSNALDYGDVFGTNEGKSFSFHSTTPRSAGRWPPPFPSTDVNADYFFEYEDGEPVTLEPENVISADEEKKADCGKGDFYCSENKCISKSAVCDGNRDCQNGNDEVDCQEYLKRFSSSRNSQLNVLENQRWLNVSEATCALLCIRSTNFECRSFNYRKIDRTCFLSTLNIGLTGSLRQHYPYDYYELKSGTIDCTLMFECNDDKCIANNQLCDGFADCSNREDEKNCKAEDFGYSLKLSGTDKSNEGRVEVTAFGKTGYICDDKFDIEDANVICKELGFQMGAAEVKGQSFYATDLKETNTLYMIDDLECIGNETTLIDCDFPGWGVHNCRNQEIAGLVCKTPQEKCGKGSWKCDTGNECISLSFVCDGLFDCADDSDEGAQHCEAATELRLANGTSNTNGRLEIKHHGVWGTVCDDDFNEDAAKVVCRYFGFRGAVTVKKDAYFGPGDGPIWLDQVSCYGNETELYDCTHWDWGEHNCDHNEDVGVICSNDVEDIQVQRHSKINDGYSSSTAALPTSCGYRKDNIFLDYDLVQQRVIGGFTAKKGDYPWQATLRIKDKAQQFHLWCGAIIISSQWVLTAAHCLLGYPKGAYVVVAGEYNTDEDEGTEQKKYIEEYFIHKNFTQGSRMMKNDIALIKVKGVGFTLNNDVQAICLPDENTDYEKELNCTVSGFGSVKTGSSTSSRDMMAAWVPVIKSDICKMPHVYGTSMTEGMICAGFLNGGVDSCHGDSGGPLACLDNGLFTLYGITSWGHRCGFANKPGVYVKVAHYKKWIDNTIKEHS